MKEAPRANRNAERGRSTRAHLLEIASGLFAERGFDNTSVELVLERAGVSKGSLYHHFDDKQDLFVAVLEHVEEQLIEQVTLGAAEARSPEEALRLGGRAFLRQATRGAVRQIALLDAPAALGWKRWREIEARYGLGLITATLKRINPDDPRDQVAYTAHTLMATLIELGLLVAHSEDADAAALEAEATYMRILSALAPG